MCPEPTHWISSDVSKNLNGISGWNARVLPDALSEVDHRPLLLWVWVLGVIPIRLVAFARGFEHVRWRGRYVLVAEGSIKS